MQPSQEVVVRLDLYTWMTIFPVKNADRILFFMFRSVWQSDRNTKYHKFQWANGNKSHRDLMNMIQTSQSMFPRVFFSKLSATARMVTDRILRCRRNDEFGWRAHCKRAFENPPLLAAELPIQVNLTFSCSHEPFPSIYNFLKFLWQLTPRNQRW